MQSLPKIKNIEIHNKPYFVKEDEFPIIPTIPPFEVKKGLSDLDRQVYLLDRLSKYSTNLVSIGYDHGFYAPINCKNFTSTIIGCQEDEIKIAISNKSNGYEEGKNIQITTYQNMSPIKDKCILRIMDKSVQLNINTFIPVIISNDIYNVPRYNTLLFVNYNENQKEISLPFNMYVYVHEEIISDFRKEFRISDTNNIIEDNLLNLLIMVKNAGEGFGDVLKVNKSYVDRWVVLDTGSTDDTIATVKRELSDLPGMLYEEPFINFRDSRNRCLELAGTQCFFNIMLDDTYILQGDKLRSFLYMARGDDYFDSFSLYIKDVDISYSSNRITKSYKGLKYEHLLHEIIQHNVNGAIPQDVCMIRDIVSPYMVKRTRERKLYDLDMLFKEYEENPTEPRTLYYIAETYLVLQDYEKAREFYKKRSQVRSGYSEEVQDSLYKVGVLSEQFLEEEWIKCHEMYLECYNYDTTRSESLYLIGNHYYKKGQLATAFMYLSQGFSLGIPAGKNMNIRLNIYCYHLPLVLAKCCIQNGQFELGMKCVETMKSYQNDTTVSYLEMVFNQLLVNKNSLQVKEGIIYKERISAKKTIAFVIDGGWDKWDGETYSSKGLGGSETFVIKYAETMKRMGYNTIVFCNCEGEKVWNNVKYAPITMFSTFIARFHIDVCIINRYPEYVPLTCFNSIPTYLVMHDLPRDDDLYFNNQFFKGLLCISEWHSEYMRQRYPHIRDIVQTVSYGIDLTKFRINSGNRDSIKIKKSFIFPSFPNRGLLPLLQIFSKVIQKHPDAVLHVFCDTRHKFVRQHYPQEMDEIDRLLSEMRQNVINHGWVNPLILNMYWSKCSYWLYPCKFLETCCLTAYEAAASHTLAITNHLAALAESVGDRGIIQNGDVMTNEWQDQMVSTIDKLLTGEISPSPLLDKNYEWIQTKTYDNVVRDFVSKYIENN